MPSLASRCVRLSLIALALSFSVGSAAAAQKEHSALDGVDGKFLFDFKVMQMISDQLGNNYDNLQMVVSACQSGGFADEAGRLQGKYSVAVSRNKKEKEAYKTKNDDSTAVGERGGPGLQGMPEYEHQFYFGWASQWIKKMRFDATATAAELFAAAKANDFDTDAARNSCAHVCPNGGDAVKVALGAGKNEAILYSNYNSDVGAFCQLYRGLRDVGYSDGTTQNAKIDCAFRTDQARNLGKRTDAVFVDRKAEAGALKTMLIDLKNRLDNTKKAFIFLIADGGVGEFKEELAPGLAIQVGSGRFLTPADGIVSIHCTANLLPNFFEDVATDDPDLRRGHPVSVLVTSSQETYAGPVTVQIDGVTVGTFQMLGSAAGHEYQLDVPDAALQSLYGSGAVADSTLDLRFAFPGGTPSSLGFRMATEADMDAGLTELYGIALGGPTLRSGPEAEPLPSSEVPAVGPLAVVALLAGLSGLAAGAIARGRRTAEARSDA